MLQVATILEYSQLTVLSRCVTTYFDFFDFVGIHRMYGIVLWDLNSVSLLLATEYRVIGHHPSSLPEHVLIHELTPARVVTSAYLDRATDTDPLIPKRSVQRGRYDTRANETSSFNSNAPTMYVGDNGAQLDER